MERIIDVYYGRDNLPYKDEARTIHFPVAGSEFLGASQTTTIRFHYEQIGTDENVYTVESKRPDGKTGSQLLSKNTTEHYAEMSLSGWYSECKGDLYLSLKVYRGGTTATYNETTQLWEVSGVPVIESTGAIKLAINYTPMGRYENYEDAVETFQQVLAALGDKLDTIKGIVVVSGLSQVDTTEYEEGQLFFDVDTKNIYKLESGEFVKINNKLEIVDVSGYEYEELFAMFGTQPFMSYFEETTNLAVYQFKQSGDDYALYVWTYKDGCLYMPYVDMSAIFSIDDFTNVEYEKAPVVVLTNEVGTLSDLDYEKVLQPNATIKLEELYFVKAYENDTIIEFWHYNVGHISSNSYVGYHNISISKQNKYYRLGSVEELFYDKTKTDQLLTNKQDKLVSGTSIKTINNISLLGSGNIDIQGGSGDAEWGSIGGDIADQTDLQNELQDIREVAEGKTNTFVISDDIEGLTEQTFVANEYKRADGTPIATWADFLSYVDDSSICSNTSFDNDSEYGVDIGYTYFITTNNKIIKSNTLKNGDNIYVVQLNVPDRWFNEEDGYAYPLETSKVNLDNYSTKTETSTEVNKVAHDIAVEYDENTLYGSGDLCIKDKLLYKCNTDDTTGTWDSTKWDLTTVNSELGIVKASSQSYTDNKLLDYVTKIGSLPSYTFNNVSQLISQFVEANSIPLKTPFVLLGISDGPYTVFIDKGGTNYTFRGYCLRYKQYIDYYGPDTYVVNLLGQQSSYAINLATTTDLSGYVDLTSAQTISGLKTFSRNAKFTGGIGASDSYTPNIFARNIWINNALFNGVGSNFGIRVPSTIGLTADKELATTDQAFNVINVADLSLSGTTYTLTDEQFAKMRNGKPTIFIGNVKTQTSNIDSVIFYPSNRVNDTTLFDGICIGNNYNARGFGWCYLYRLTVATKTLSIMTELAKIDTGSNKTSITGLQSGLSLGYSNQSVEIKSKMIPNYPTTNTSPQVLTIGANGGSLSWENHMTEWYGTQAQYDALGTYDSNTIYNILES